MSKLYLKFNSMNCGKSTTLLQIAYNYDQLGKKILVLKPRVDTKGDKKIISRLGIDRNVDFLIEGNEDLFLRIKMNYSDVDCILIDEGQFLSEKNVMDLSRIVGELNIPIIAFALKNTFRGEPFTGSSWLFAMAQEVEEVSTRTLCECGKRATINIRKVNGEVTFEGGTVGIDGKDDVTYDVVCVHCFWKLKNKHDKEDI